MMHMLSYLLFFYGNFLDVGLRVIVAGNSDFSLRLLLSSNRDTGDVVFSLDPAVIFSSLMMVCSEKKDGLG